MMNQSPIEMLNAYVRAFESQQAADVVLFYHLPCTFIRPDGVWIVQDEATALVLANHLIEHAKAQGYDRTEAREIKIRALARGLVELNGMFIRYDVSNSEIGRFGFTYIIRSISGVWKIVVAAAHDADAEETVIN